MSKTDRPSDVIRRALKADGRTHYLLAQQAGINRSVLGRFVGGAAMTTDSLDALAPVLRLRIVQDAPEGLDAPDDAKVAQTKRTRQSKPTTKRRTTKGN